MGNWWLLFLVIPVVAIVMDGVVKIIKASKSKHPAADTKQLQSLEDKITDLETDLVDARSRIEVLEKIVIDDKFQLSRDIDDLARQA